MAKTFIELDRDIRTSANTFLLSLPVGAKYNCGDLESMFLNVVTTEIKEIKNDSSMQFYAKEVCRGVVCNLTLNGVLKKDDAGYYWVA